jgi:hypothetical protein
VLYTPQMWMRDHCVEAFSRQPIEAAVEDEEDDWD